MPPGRPSKRIGESVDGDSSDEHGVKVKSQRTQKATPQNDFSSVVKSKLQSYTRTGQACDRCKVSNIEAYAGGSRLATNLPLPAIGGLSRLS